MQLIPRRFILGLFLLLSLQTMLHAQLRELGDGTPGAVKAPHLTAELISDANTIAPGSEGRVALSLTMEQGWHVYWVNAGDAGEPPRVQWMPVEGLAIGPMQFPVPSRLPVGPMMDYGYEGVAIFPYNVKTSAALASAKIRVAAHVQWLVCREVCLPGKAFLGVDLPVTPGASGGTKRVIDEAVHAEPTEIPAAVKIEVTGIRRIGA